MRGGDTASRPGGDELTARVFRALYGAYDLHSVEGVHVVVPRRTPCFAGSSLGDVARQISDHEQQHAGRAE
jgi:hypothetical protein